MLLIVLNGVADLTNFWTAPLFAIEREQAGYSLPFIALNSSFL